MVDLSSYSEHWEIEFICPFCGTEASIIAEQWCPVTNTVMAFDRLEEEEDCGIEWGDSDIQESNEPTFFRCGYCNSLIDPDIQTNSDLFNWLYDRQMIYKA